MHTYQFHICKDCHVAINFVVGARGQLKEFHVADGYEAKLLFYGIPPFVITHIAETYRRGYNKGLVAE